jgi:hypothetical protein
MSIVKSLSVGDGDMFYIKHGFAVQENLRRVFHGEAPKHMIQPKEKPALPVSTG